MYLEAFINIWNFDFNKRLFNFYYLKKVIKNRQKTGNHSDHLPFDYI